MATRGSFKPGHDPRRNTHGRPRKGCAVAEILRAIGDEKYTGADGQTKREAVLRRVYDAALNGDLDAAKWIADRTDGKVTDTLRLEGGQRLEIVEEIVDVAQPVP
jgi:hypothetical protein